MRSVKLFFVVFVVLALHPFASGALGQTNAVSPEIIAALDKGNAVQLSNFFNATVELVLPDKSDIYSKQQGASVVSDFFKENPVTRGFQVVHSGTKDASSFVIGNLNTSNAVYRVYVLVRGADGANIQQLRIER